MKTIMTDCRQELGLLREVCKEEEPDHGKYTSCNSLCKLSDDQLSVTLWTNSSARYQPKMKTQRQPLKPCTPSIFPIPAAIKPVNMEIRLIQNYSGQRLYLQMRQLGWLS